MLSFASSLEVDMRLLPYDVAATKAHAHVLAHAGLLDDEDVDAVETTLTTLLERWVAGSIAPDGDEDVHSFVERVLTDELGSAGRRIHAGRSRNDLVATDFRLWCRDAAGEAVGAIRDLIELLLELAERHTGTVMPGYTHLQRAQPVSLGFHLMAHGFALSRDLGRFNAAFDAADVSALGAGALAGNTLELDPYIATTKLGMARTFDNAMDAVSDRDFAADLLYACAMCGVHLSRLAEEIVLWTSSEFGFARLSDDWSTGSSMMPQKRNPDVAELTRGRAGATIGDLTGLLAVLKGLPLAYDRDLQEDKGIVFGGFDRIFGSLGAMKGLLASITFDEERMAATAGAGSSWATDLAEILVRRGVPFRDAHEKVGALVAELESPGVELEAELRTREGFLPEDAKVLDPSGGLARRDSRGGTAPNRVLEQIEQLKAHLAASSTG
jgi:argininosuccinate lyase